MNSVICARPAGFLKITELPGVAGRIIVAERADFLRVISGFPVDGSIYVVGSANAGIRARFPGQVYTLAEFHRKLADPSFTGGFSRVFFLDILDNLNKKPALQKIIQDLERMNIEIIGVIQNQERVFKVLHATKMRFVEKSLPDKRIIWLRPYDEILKGQKAIFSEIHRICKSHNIRPDITEIIRRFRETSHPDLKRALLEYRAAHILTTQGIPQFIDFAGKHGIHVPGFLRTSGGKIHPKVDFLRELQEQFVVFAGWKKTREILAECGFTVIDKNTGLPAGKTVVFYEPPLRISDTVRAVILVSTKSEHQNLSAVYVSKHITGPVILPAGESSGPRVYVDFRERKNRIPEKLSAHGCEVCFAALATADYILSEDIGIEVKIGEDFHKSLVDGRLFSEAEKMAANFSAPLFLLVGAKPSTPQQTGAVCALAVKFRIPVLFVENEDLAAEMIATIAKQYQTRRDFAPRGKKSGRTATDIAVDMLCRIPGVGPKTAKKILTRFATLRSVANSSMRALTETPGISQKLAENIYGIFNHEYDG